MITWLGIIILIGLTAGALWYPEQCTNQLERMGITVFSGNQSQRTRHIQFRTGVLVVFVTILLMIIGGRQIQIGMAGVVLGILCVYYSTKIARMFGADLPSLGGMAPNTVVNVTGLGLIMFGVGWMTGILQDILRAVIVVFSS